MIDVISVSAVFDQPVAVAFIDDGVWLLFDQTNVSSGKNTTKFLSALPTFDVSEFMVERESLYREGLLERFQQTRTADPQSFLNHVTIKDRSVMRARMRDFGIVVTG